MSIIVINVKNEGNLPILKKIIGVFKEKINIFSNEEYRDRIASELIEEGLKTELLSEEQTKKEFQKRGVTY